MVPRTFIDEICFDVSQFKAKSTSSLVLTIAIFIDLRVQESESVVSKVLFCKLNKGELWIGGSRIALDEFLVAEIQLRLKKRDETIKERLHSKRNIFRGCKTETRPCSFVSAKSIKVFFIIW